MFSKLALIAAASLALFVTAAPASDGSIDNSCNTGPVQCCNSLVGSKTKEANMLFALLGIALDSVRGQVGVTCNPITVIGTGSGASCTSQPVCCENNSFNGVVAIGCSPVNINL